MGAFMSKNDFPVKGRTVLLTGGSRGMGLSVGRQLAEKGANVVIVARDEAKLQEGIAYIAQGAASPPTQRFHHISADLIDAAESTRVLAETTAWNDGAPPDVVWCCAGSSHPTLFVDTPVAQLRNQMDSNYFSSAYMAHAALTAWLRPAAADDHGMTTTPLKDESTRHLPDTSSSSSKPPPPARHLVFTASFLALYSFAGYAPYSPSKAALRSLSDSLSQEMNLYAAAQPAAPRVRVHTVFPATIFTESYEAENRIKADVTRQLEEGDEGQTPHEVARRSIAGLERGEELVATTLLTRLVLTSVLGGSVRGGVWKGAVDAVLSWVVVLVMVFVRGDMDRKVRRWGREHGPSGMRKG